MAQESIDRHFRLLSEVSEILVGSATPEELGTRLTRAVRDALAVDACIVRVLDGGMLRLVHGEGVPASLLIPVMRADMGIAARLIGERRPFAIENSETDPTTSALHLKARGTPGHYTFMSYAGAPMIVRGEVIGLVGVYTHEEPRRFTDDDLAQLQTIASQVGIALLNHRLYDEARNQNLKLVEEAEHRSRSDHQNQQSVMFDALTGLPRRALFLEHLSHAMRSTEYMGRLAVLYVDCDHFGLVNESLGHQLADSLLMEVSRRLMSVARPGDVVARISSDEFAVLVQGYVSEGALRQYLRRVNQVLGQIYKAGAEDVPLTFSIGVALPSDRHHAPEEVLRDGELAMRHAKKGGRNQLAFFQPDMLEERSALMTLELDLHRALHRDKLGIAYQPIVRVADRAVVGIEALARWEHPLRGWIPPAQFIPIAEEAGLIRTLGWKIFELAIRDALGWLETVPNRPFLTVNVSPRQLNEEGFVDRLAEMLEESCFPADRLRLEITESSLMHQPHVVLQALVQLREYGIQLVIDDFGTGYSSLSYLHRLPVMALKIDQSFAERLDEESGRRMVRSIIHIARNMELEVVIEGVEREETHERIRELGIEMAQGFLYARPTRAGDLAALLGGAAGGEGMGLQKR